MDIREQILQGVSGRQYTACIRADRPGIISGIPDMKEKAAQIGLTIEYAADEGEQVYDKDIIVRFTGTAGQIAQAEDHLIGTIAKASGIATAARAFVNASNGIHVVAGAWKKMPLADKRMLRRAVETGGASCRMLDENMVYLDKNYVAFYGGIKQCLRAVRNVEGRKVIQIKGRYEKGDILKEAWTAIAEGASVLFLDNGNINDLRKLTENIHNINTEQTGENVPIEIAFGQNITMEDMPVLAEIRPDHICVGKAIVDAPLLDMSLDVLFPEKYQYAHGESYDVLDKTELRFRNIQLSEANLTDIAAVVADVLGIASEDVFVIDVRNGVLDLDILKKNVDPHSYVARKRELLSRLKAIPGVVVTDETEVESRGMLGWIALDDEISREEALETIDRSAEMRRQIRDYVSKRVLIYASGTEVENGEIEDTNTPMLKEHLEKAGYTVDYGGILKDDEAMITGRLRRAVENGYGTVITTGGVGAEDKDHSVEAIERLDPEAATPYLVKVHKGHGRHVKDGIRIGVGQAGETVMIALPGPNAEVRACLDTLISCMDKMADKEETALKLANVLRHRLREKMHHNDHVNQEERNEH